MDGRNTPARSEVARLNGVCRSLGEPVDRILAGDTRNGTPIDLFDRVGVQTDEPAPGMTLEAAFGPEGAVRVRHIRLPDVLGMDALAAQCRRFAGRLSEACDESAPALLYVRSHGR